MSTNFTSPVARSNPIGEIGRWTIAFASYFGGLALLSTQALRALIAPRGDSKGLHSLVNAELAWMFKMGLPLVGLLHIGLGSFLAMQAYYGGTFVDGTGAVVGVGLFRNISPMMAGMALAGILCARITPALRLAAIPSIGAELDLPKVSQEQDRLVFSKVVAAMLSGFVLTFWGCLVGTIIGWRVALKLMGVSTHSFFLMFRDMIWIDDIIGALMKGLIYGGFAGLIACYEGLRKSDATRFDEIADAAFRATCLAWIAILAVNSGWFLLFYHAGSAFGPTLMAAPNS